LHNAINDDVLDAAVFTFSILTDEDGVDVVVGGFVAGNGFAGADVGKKVESSAESEVE